MPTKKPLVSLLIPVYCEADHLQDFLQKIDSLTFDWANLELIFINDKSTDDSLKILESFVFKSKHVIITNTKNCGKGSCIRSGIQVAEGEVIGIQDCDFEYDFADIPQLVQPIIRGELDVALSSRFNPVTCQVYRTRHYLKNRAITSLSNIFSDLRVSDVSSCYKFFAAPLIKSLSLSSRRFSIDVEIIAHIARTRKLRIKEFPVSYRPRSYADGKKITWRDGIAVALHIVYFNLRAGLCSKSYS